MTLRIEHVGFGDDRVEYGRAWQMQRELHERVVAGTAPDTVLLLEHPPVYTAGTRTELHERPFDGTPVVDVDRGGKVTWHGPGQLVGYPIVRLEAPIDVVAYVRRLEKVMQRICAEFGVHVRFVEGRTGAWMDADERGPERKIGAIGVRVSRQVTMHGFALNADVDLSVFDNIVPCGITDAGVTSLSFEAGRRITVHDLLPVAHGVLLDADLPGLADAVAKRERLAAVGV